MGQLSTMSAFNDLQDQVFDDYSTELKALQIRRQATAKRAAEVAAVEKQMAQEKKAVDAKLAEAKELLAELKDEEREPRSSPAAAPPACPPTSPPPAAPRSPCAPRWPRSATPTSTAPWAPSAFDCSGLTMFSWGAAGVGLPHSSSAQFGSGPRIAASDAAAR